MHYHNKSATGIRIIPNYSFPFQDLENDEFLKTIGSWVYNAPINVNPVGGGGGGGGECGQGAGI